MSESADEAPVKRERTAIHRPHLSRPLQVAVDDGIISALTSVFDYGCGFGDDVRFLRSMNIFASGWDPASFPENEKQEADIVNVGYVVNVIEDPVERASVLADAWRHTRQVLIVSARLVQQGSSTQWRPFADGLLTGRGTFQKFFTHDELARWVKAAIDATPVTAAPGVLYVFRQIEAREGFLASTMRRTSTPRVPPYETLYDAHKDELERLADFVRKQGRLPTASDAFEASELQTHCGTVGRAFLTLKKVYGSAYWAENADRAKQDLLVYLALAKFRGRTPFNQLPEPLREDVRAHFGTYARACNSADELLYGTGNPAILREAMESAGVGKLTPGGLYVHRSALPILGSLLRTYEGCGRVLVGMIEACNVIKLHRSHFGVSYLCYPGFESNAHPALAGSVHVDFKTREVRIRDYTNSDNPPLLHRKELFVAPDHPLRKKFKKLTAQEEKLHLLDDTSRIGTKSAWEEIIGAKGLRLNGHVVRRIAPYRVTSPIPDSTD